MSYVSRDYAEVLQVVGFDSDRQCYLCIDQDGVKRRIDLHVGNDGSGELPDDDDLIGRHVRISGSQAFVELAAWPVTIEDSR